MRDFLVSPVVNVLAAIAGGVLLGYGLGTIPGGVRPAGMVCTVLGLIILWWALVDRRKAMRGTPESERDGSHTIE